MFKNSEYAKNLCWHANDMKVDGVLRHPVDTPSWRLVDHLWLDFGFEPRNLRLGLSTYGINPYRDLSTKYSCWPVIAIINLRIRPFHAKNVLMNIIGTLLDIPGKSKDGLSARLDLVEINIRPELAPMFDGSRTYIPATCYTLSREEKVSICRTLSDLKVPKGYSSNFRSLVSLKNLMLSSLKSHDCHVLMQQLLLVAIRGVLPNNVRVAITRLCSFFNAICSRTLRISDLDKLQQDVETLCLLEKYFPPSFFTIMVHLCVHLVREAKLCGPIYLQWMYPFERYIKVLKSFVRNRNRPERSIAEANICEEAVEFCSEFLSGLDPIGLGSFKSREEGRIERTLSAGSSVIPSQVMREIQKGQVVSTTIRWIAHGPHPVVMIYKGYKVNGICYNTKPRDDTRTVQNSGVMFVASTMHMASAKDKNPIIADMSFYSVIQGIWKVSYNTLGVTLFRCDWVDTKDGVRVDDLRFTLVDLNRIGHYSDSFILASQVRQVFYVKDPSDGRWFVVVKPQEKDFVDNCYNDELDDTSLHCSVILECPTDMTREDEEIPYIRVDCEGTWGTFDSKLEDLLVWNITYQTMTLGKQARLEAGCSSISSTEGVINKGKGTRGPMGMSEITRVSCDGHKRVVEYNELDQPIGESATKLKSFIGTTMVSNKGRERRKNNKYNHRMSRKGYANLAEEMLIDRALVWKKAQTTKDGEIPDIDTKEVANKIDNLLVSKRATHSMDNVTCDILSQAIGGNDPPGTIPGVDQYVTPSKYFHTAREKRKKVVATKGETNESKIKRQMVSKSIDTLDDANDHDAEEENRQVLEDLTIEKQDKVGDENKYVCASIETLTKVKDNVVSTGTIFDYDMDGDNVKVSVDMVAMVIASFLFQQGKMKSVYQIDPRLPSLTLNTKRTPVTLRLLLWELDYIGSKIQIHPISTQCIDAFMFHLYKVVEEKGTLGSYNLADAGSVSVGISKEDRAQILNARLLGTDHCQILMFPYNSGHRFFNGTAYWMDRLRNRINNDASDVVRMAFDISNKKKPVWRIIKCPKQGGIMECGYYVM
ncbi:transposase [Cucumis melo var. makuwa]|uniref:Transposase n=1 Tax=Cucumis melo var. makuwa TaxID=1194695 RepID=A0A5A7T7N2_CUCMM|nr:transposase [Cucumis melo var. makuwa]